MLNRRDLLLSSGAAVAVAGLAPRLIASVQGDRLAFGRLFDFFQEGLHGFGPESATQRGLDEGYACRPEVSQAGMTAPQRRVPIARAKCQGPEHRPAAPPAGHRPQHADR